jgi:nucleoside triphosphate diphosphatase
VALEQALLDLQELTRRLRRDCPWDREQDERSIVPHTIEEAYELADAAHSEDDGKLLDELGDVLFQVYFLSLLLEERGAGDLAAVARGTTAKLVRRHPHVFGESPAELDSLPTEARTASEVRQNWDVIKQTEERPGGIPDNLPSLLYAAKVQRRANPGAETSVEDALTSVEAAVTETKRTVASDDRGRDVLYERIGDLLFACVELSRGAGVDPEIALRRATERFRERAGSAA